MVNCVPPSDILILLLQLFDELDGSVELEYLRLVEIVFELLFLPNLLLHREGLKEPRHGGLPVRHFLDQI